MIHPVRKTKMRRIYGLMMHVSIESVSKKTIFLKHYTIYDEDAAVMLITGEDSPENLLTPQV